MFQFKKGNVISHCLKGGELRKTDQCCPVLPPIGKKHNLLAHHSRLETPSPTNICCKL